MNEENKNTEAAETEGGDVQNSGCRNCGTWPCVCGSHIPPTKPTEDMDDNGNG